MLEGLDAGALSAVAAGIGADLATAAESGDSGQFQVDLQALHDYYFKVYEIWTRLSHHTNALPQDPYAMACLNNGQIPGVSEAIQSTVEGALGTSTESMRKAMQLVRGNLATHLQALHDVYIAYVNTDSQNASKLTQAGSPHAANINVKLPTPPASPFEVSGWALGLVSGLEG
ncbi:MAG TPA: hypothetical protein VFE19_04550 [Jatrophihabitantaceae bacterium]|jgi:hypothetical protein|nr:hypothetical protein [Jatrophihabitantaceae bacterium]